MRDLQLPGRSPVHAVNGMASTSHPLASATAIAVLRDGGNAVDAAIAACAVLCVAEPQSTGIGGDCFVLYSPKGGDIIAYNGSGRAPKAATAEWYAENGIGRIERNTPHAVTIPGAIDAWCRMNADHGSKDLAQLLAPAVAYARQGTPIHSRIAVDFARHVKVLSRDPAASAIFLPGGRPPAEGERHRQPQLADTLERIGREGRSGFYAGPVAEDIVSYLRDRGGLHSLEDFAAAEGEYVTPISTNFRGHDVYECPPNCHGVTALEMLNILSEFDMGGTAPLSFDRFHAQIEATRIAYRDRVDLVADPRFVPVPVERLLSQDYARRRAGEIRMDRTMGALPPGPLPTKSDTVYLCVVDRDGNAVSFINSLFTSFGSGLCAPMSGVMLQDRGRGFVLTPGHPNCIAPGKRPLHTLLPGMVRHNGKTVMPFGVMGGLYQAVGHCHFLSNLFDFGLDLQEAIDLPRVFADPKGPVEIESQIPQWTHNRLSQVGHEIVKADKPIGGGQAIYIDWEKGTLTGASDPRKDGCSLGY